MYWQSYGQKDSGTLSHLHWLIAYYINLNLPFAFNTLTLLAEKNNKIHKYFLLSNDC